MIEVTVYGKLLKKADASIIVEIDTSIFDEIDTTIKYFLSGLMAKTVSPFSTIDTIMLSNHDSGYVNSWSVTEENQAPVHVAVKYIEFVVNDIMNWVDNSRDKETEKLLIELSKNGCSVVGMLEAVTERGYDPMFASYWVGAYMLA